jgi:hypothetical protein
MTEHVHHAMDRNIFNQNLSVEATSAYILVTSLIGENQSPTLDLIREKWTVTPEKLDNALKELMQRNIVREKSAPDGQVIIFPQPSSVWR